MKKKVSPGIIAALLLLACFIVFSPARAIQVPPEAAAAPVADNADKAGNTTEYAVPAIGNSWTYRSIEDNGTITHKVTGKQDLAGTEAFKYEIYFDKDLAGIRYAARVKDEVKLFVEQDPESEAMLTHLPPRTAMKIPLKVNDTWSSEFKDIFGDAQKEVYQVIKKETVKVPAGTFEAYYIKVTITQLDGKLRPTTLDVWYAPGVGMVKQVVNEELCKYTMVLESYTIKEKITVKS